MIIIALIVTILYIFLRCLILFKYLYLNKRIHQKLILDKIAFDNSRLNRQKKENTNKTPAIDLDLDIGFFPELDIGSREKWKYLHNIDFKIKSIGTIFLSILSIILVICGIDSSNNEYLFFAVLPSGIQLLNEIFSWYEIDTPELHKPMIPCRFLAKRVYSKKIYK